MEGFLFHSMHGQIQILILCILSGVIYTVRIAVYSNHRMSQSIPTQAGVCTNTQ